MIYFDHIAIGCQTLEQGNAYVKARMGITVPIGGMHPLMGTHNHVMATGEDTFFEIIATNPNAIKPIHPRWFGLDNINFPNARPHSWILNSDDFEADIATAKSIGIDLGVPQTLTRGNMAWRFAVRSDGEIPLDGSAPMIMEWPKQPTHPAANMGDLGVRIKDVTVLSPHAEVINTLLNTLAGSKMPVEVIEAREPKLLITMVLKDGREVILD